MVVVPNSTRKEVADEILIIFISILMFYSLPNFSFVKVYFQESPYIIFGVAMVLLVFRKRILAFFNSR